MFGLSTVKFNAATGEVKIMRMIANVLEGQRT